MIYIAFLFIIHSTLPFLNYHIMRRNFTLRLSLLMITCFLSFTGLNAQTYCTPSASCGTFYRIDSVQMGTVDNTNSSCTHNYTTTAGDTMTCVAGVAQTMTITVSNYMGATAFVDLDNNFNFSGSNEMIFSVAYIVSSGPYAVTHSFSVPSNTPTGYYRLRIIAQGFGTIGASQSCMTSFSGSWQDYTLYVAGTSCDPVILSNPISATRCAGGADTMTVDAMGSGLLYQWSFGGTAIVGANTSSFIISNIDSTMAGSYTCQITSAGCSGSGVTSTAGVLSVNSLPVIYNGGPTIFCPGSSVTLTSSASSGNQWYLNNNPLFGATNQTYSASVPGVYKVIYTNNCPSSSLTDTISNYPAPAPVISPSGVGGIVKVCTGGTQAFSVNTNPNWSYQWKNNGSSIIGAIGSTFNATTSGSYTMTNTNNYGCTTVSAPVQLQVNTPPTAVVNNLGSKELCAGAYKTLYANSSDAGSTFQWQFNGSNITGATSSTYNAYTPGNYSVIANNGCNVTSAALTLSSLSFPTLTASGPTSFCIGGNVVFTSSITDTAGIQYQWLHNGTNIASANATMFTATDSGSYQILVVVDSSCTAMSSPQSVTILPAPQPVIVPTDPLGHTLNTTLVYNNYQWYWGSSIASMTAVPNATNYNFHVITTGYYAVSVSDYNACTAMSSPIYVAVTTNTTGINNAGSVGLINIYPNPASTSLHISAPFPVNVSLSGVDGRTVLQQDNATTIDLSSLADGMYIIRISDENSVLLKTDKIIKSRQ